MEPSDIKHAIESAIPGAEASVSGDGHHFEAIVVSSEFEGKGLLERHRLVFDALREQMREKIHALSLKTYTPEEKKRLSNP
ncbi:MAG: BolA/IbaG family iron-sulfur metabolism protein [Candidatus Methanosuratincola sp.]|jgi:acid stress-induced BolA-like protein IbaG/YrbA